MYVYVVKRCSRRLGIFFRLMEGSRRPSIRLPRSLPGGQPPRLPSRPSGIFQSFLLLLYLYFFLTNALPPSLYLSPLSLYRPSPHVHFDVCALMRGVVGGFRVIYFSRPACNPLAQGPSDIPRLRNGRLLEAYAFCFSFILGTIGPARNK